MTVLGQPTVTYTYDNADRLTQITQGTSTVSVGYDSAGRRTSLTLPNGVVTEYAYDPASRLSGLTYKNGPTTLGALTYTYDAAGNREGVGGSWARTMIPEPLASATYNAANQQAAFGGQAQTFDLKGNLTSDGTNTYTWDARNRLLAMSGPDLTASFQYDPLGRRTQRTVNATATGFHYDGLNPVQELNGAAVVANLLTGLGIDEYFTRADAAGTRSHLVDALGSTVAELDVALALQAEHIYEPFGAATTTGPTGNALLYTGRENDFTGLYYYRARYYHPGLQRFVSEDPVGFIAGDFNLYGYVANSPTTFTDPLGLDKRRQTYTIGIQLAGVLGGLNQGPAGRRGWLSQITFGVAYDPTTATLQGFRSTGKLTPGSPEGEAVGIGLGGNVVYGQSYGGLDNLYGESVEYSVSALLLGVTESQNAAGDPTGFSVGLGPGKGLSATTVTTTTVPIGPQFKVPWR
jgi:RHS repeat-associated protein